MAGSILDLITARQTAAAAQAEQLREQITTLTEQLAAVDTELADLATTRATLLRLTGPPDDPPPTDATLTSTAYQQILAVFATAESELRAKNICRDDELETAHQFVSPAKVLTGRVPRHAAVDELQRQLDETRVALHAAEADLLAVRNINQRLLVETSKLIDVPDP